MWNIGKDHRCSLPRRARMSRRRAFGGLGSVFTHLPPERSRRTAVSHRKLLAQRPAKSGRLHQTYYLKIFILLDSRSRCAFPTGSSDAGPRRTSRNRWGVAVENEVVANSSFTRRRRSRRAVRRLRRRTFNMRRRAAVARCRKYRSECQLDVAHSLAVSRVAISRNSADRSTYHDNIHYILMSECVEFLGGLTDGWCGIAERSMNTTYFLIRCCRISAGCWPRDPLWGTPRNLEPHYLKPGYDPVRIDLDSDRPDFTGVGAQVLACPRGLSAGARRRETTGFCRASPKPGHRRGGQIRARFLGTPPTSQSPPIFRIRSKHREPGPDQSKVQLPMIYQCVLETPFDPGWGYYAKESPLIQPMFL